MGTLKKELKKYYESDNLYELFNIELTASNDDVKKAYRKLALKTHPDRVEEDGKKTATLKFQLVGKVYSILSDDKKRELYDQTGVVSDDLISDKVSDWKNYFESVFKKVNVIDIDQFEKEYVGSEEEKLDLRKYYMRFEGDMNKIMEHLFFYKFEEEDRYRKVMQDLIKTDDVPEFDSFTQEGAKSVAARRKKCEAEARAVKKQLEKCKKDGQSKSAGAGDADLVNLIQQRQRERGDIANHLLAKYDKEDGKKVGGEQDDDDEDDEDFGGFSGDDVGSDEGSDEKDESEEDSEASDNESDSSSSDDENEEVVDKAPAKKSKMPTKSAPAAKRPRRN